MAYDCPFGFYIRAKSKYCWVFAIAAAFIASVGIGLFVYGWLNVGTLQEKQLDLLLKVAGGMVTGVALWLFKEAYKHFQPMNFMSSVCERLGALNQPPESPEKTEQIEILTTNGWKICNEP